MSQTEFDPAVPRRKLRFALRIVGSLLIAAAAVAIVFLGVNFLRREIIEQRCREHLEYLSHTLMIFRPNTGHFPPAYLMDSNGRRVCSWRACVVPVVDFDYGGSGRTYAFHEPWDSPANTRFREETGYYEYYSCPFSAAASPNATYLCVVGGAALARAENKGRFVDGAKFALYQRGRALPRLGKAILLVEVIESDIPWTKPEDISLSEIASLLRDDASGDRFRRRIRRIVAVDAKESMQILDPARDIEEIKNLVESEEANAQGGRAGAKSPIN